MATSYNVYDTGDVVLITVTFTRNGALVTPGTVVLKVYDPGGTTTTYTVGGVEGVNVINDSTGVYHFQLQIPDSAASSGTWHYRWKGTGANAGTEDTYFIVRDTVF